MRQQGYSIIEVLITIVVAGIFLAAIYSLLQATMTLGSSTSQRFAADSLSYANMRKYSSSSPAAWFTCSGGVLTLVDDTSPVAGLPSPVSQKVEAEAVFGCSGDDEGTPIRIISTVTYGPNNTTTRNATYANW